MTTRRIAPLLAAALALMLQSWLAPPGWAQTATGSIAVRVYQCPPGMQAENLAPESCGTQGGISVFVALTTPSGQTFGFQDGTEIVDADPFVLVWDGLPFGTYRFTARPHDTIYSAGEDVVVDRAPTITLDAATPTVGIDVYHLFPGDTDADGLDDAYEGEIGTDPTDPDTDGDGLPDLETRVPGGDIPACDPLAPDTDDDGLADGQEVDQLGTICTNADTDGDGAPDGAEIERGTDPRDPASRPAGEGGFGALTVGALSCPAGFQGTDFATRCTTPLANATFIAGPGSGADAPTDAAATNASGLARFTLPAGPIFFASDEVADNSGTVANWSASCANAAGDTIPINGDRNVAALDLPGADIVTCTYYVVPVPGTASPSPSAKPSATGTPVRQLPSTGTGPEAAAAGRLAAPILTLVLVGGTALTLLLALRRRVE